MVLGFLQTFVVAVFGVVPSHTLLQHHQVGVLAIDQDMGNGSPPPVLFLLNHGDRLSEHHVGKSLFGGLPKWLA